MPSLFIGDEGSRMDDHEVIAWNPPIKSGRRKAFYWETHEY